jgi:hypothetical protein
MHAKSGKNGSLLKYFFMVFIRPLLQVFPLRTAKIAQFLALKAKPKAKPKSSPRELYTFIYGLFSRKCLIFDRNPRTPPESETSKT